MLSPVLRLLSRAFQFGRQSGAFVLLTYSLLPVVFLLRTSASSSNPKTPYSHLDLLRPVFSVIVIFIKLRRLPDPLEYQEMVLTLSEPAEETTRQNRKLRADSPPITKTSRSLDRAFIHSFLQTYGRPSGLVSGLIRDRLCFALDRPCVSSMPAASSDVDHH